MQLTNIKIFCDLVESKNFSKAAKINDVTQSAVSQQIQAMERRFKVLLIDRTQKRFSLTQAGVLAYKAAKEIMHIHDKLMGDISELSAITSGTLRISSIYSIGLHVLPDSLKKFSQTYPSVNLRTSYRRASTIYDEVVDGVADFGFVAYPSKTRQIDITLFAMDRLVLVMSPDHPLAKDKNITVRSIAGQRFVSFDDSAPTRIAIDHILDKNKVIVDIVMEFDNIETVKRAVQISEGLAFVPYSTVKDEEKDGSLLIRRFEGNEYKRPLAVLSRKGRNFTPAMNKFMDIINEKG